MNRIDVIRPDAPQGAKRGPFVAGVRTAVIAYGDQPVLGAEGASGQDRAARDLTCEIWYPAAKGTAAGCSYQTITRGLAPAVLHGSAARDAKAAAGRYPLVVISHGWPGNRHLLAHLGEHLASHGYFVVAPDHPDSLYQDQSFFGATLYHRPRDQARVLAAYLAGEAPLAEHAQAENAAVVGYSMGGYGALVLGGAGLAPNTAGRSTAPPGGWLAEHVEGHPALTALFPPNLRTIITFGPWGRHKEMWDPSGLAGLKIPVFVLAGSRDDTSGYEGMRAIWAEATGVSRRLLTFVNAGHNAGAPMPAPREAWESVPHLPFSPFEHYADAVWDTVRMNNISQHAVLAWLDHHLRGQGDRLADWPDFAGAEGLVMEYAAAGQAVTA